MIYLKNEQTEGDGSHLILGLQVWGFCRELWEAYRIGGHQVGDTFWVGCFSDTVICRCLGVLDPVN
jgi:hypothetical protein